MLLHWLAAALHASCSCHETAFLRHALLLPDRVSQSQQRRFLNSWWHCAYLEAGHCCTELELSRQDSYLDSTFVVYIKFFL